MAYFKSVNKTNGSLTFGKNVVYVQAQDILWALHFIAKKSVGVNPSVTMVSEDEFVINACILSNDNSKVKVMSSREIKKQVIPALQNERKVNKTIQSGEVTKTLITLVNACDSACSASEKGLYEQVLKNWLVYNYEHQDEILNNNEDEELYCKNA